MSQARRQTGEIVALVLLFLGITVFTVVGFAKDWMPPVASQHGAGVDGVIHYLLRSTGPILVLGALVLMQVAEDQVVLRSGDSRQVLKLHPAVERLEIERAKPVAPAAAKSAPFEAKAKREAGGEAAPKANPRGKEPGATADRDTGAR